MAEQIPIPAQITVPAYFPDFPNEKHYGKIYPGPHDTTFERDPNTEYGKVEHENLERG